LVHGILLAFKVKDEVAIQQIPAEKIGGKFTAFIFLS
jgi:hypothetical protein